MQLSKLILLNKFKIGTKIVDIKDEDVPFGIITEILKNGYTVDWYEYESDIGDETEYNSDIYFNEILKEYVILLN